MERTGGTTSTHGFVSILACGLAALAVTGCGGETGIPDDGASADRPIDSIFDPPIDGPPIDTPSPIDATVDAAGCGNDVLFTGYYYDWDSTLGDPNNLFGSRWTVMGEPTRTTTSAASGLVSMCISPVGISRISVTGPTGYIGAVFLADPAVFSTPGTRFIVRGLRTDMASAQYQEFLGAGYSSGQAHVMVYNTSGPNVPLALAPVLNPPPPGSFVRDEPFSDITWAAGDTGKTTLFPNRTATPNTATLTSTSTFTGPTEIPLVANAFTIVAIRTQP